MWLQTGNEKQWLEIEHRRIASQAEAHRGDPSNAITTAVRLGRVLRAVLAPTPADTTHLQYGSARDRLAAR